MLDIGMITLPDAILLKSASLTTQELMTVRQHPVEGERICESLQSLASALPVIRHHHERFDGAGYPDGRAGRDIQVGARIAAVADAWDALTHERPYRPQQSPAQAARVLRDGARTQWDRGSSISFSICTRRVCLATATPAVRRRRPLGDSLSSSSPMTPSIRCPSRDSGSISFPGPAILPMIGGKE